MLKQVLFLLLLCCCSQAYANPSQPSSLAAIQTLIEQGNTTLAITKLQKLLKDEPSHYQAWFLLGVNQAEKRQFDDAITAFRHVIALQPKLAEPHNNLAVIYNETGEFQAAVDELEASIALKPGYLTAQENIGDLYIKLAADAYRKILANNDNPILQRRYQRLLHIRDDATSDSNTGQTSTVTPTVTSDPPSAASNIQQAASTPKITTQANKPTHSVLKALEAWRLAWSHQNIVTYFAAYSDEFQFNEKFSSLEKWKDYKAWAIGKRTFIQISIENIVVSMAAEDVRQLNFVQHFKSDSFNSDNNKEMLFKQTPDGWKIIRETSSE